MTLHLTIGNKAYSSWSLRPWILMRTLGLPFDEAVVHMYGPDSGAEMRRASPTGKLPVLRDGELVIPETIAIVEYLAETHPEAAIWPRDRAARATARAISAEMHAGFARLRQACPTMFRREPAAVPIEAIWAEARARFGQGGPFLFGGFSAADAMYAPVVNRLHAYAIPVAPGTRAYMDAVMALPAWRSWVEGAAAEPWRAPYDQP